MKIRYLLIGVTFSFIAFIVIFSLVALTFPSLGIIPNEDKSFRIPTAEEHQQIFFPFLDELENNSIVNYCYDFKARPRNYYCTHSQVTFFKPIERDFFLKTFSDTQFADRNFKDVLYESLILSMRRDKEKNELPTWFIDPNKNNECYQICLENKDSEQFQDWTYWYYPEEKTLYLVAVGKMKYPYTLHHHHFKKLQ